MKISLINEFGKKVQVKAGFSWTTFFWGAWVPLFHGQVAEFFKFLVFAPITLSIYAWIQCFKGNKKYIEYLLEKGYKPVTATDQDMIKKYSELTVNVATNNISPN
jgi:hypothetical protein